MAGSSPNCEHSSALAYTSGKAGSWLVVGGSWFAVAVVVTGSWVFRHRARADRISLHRPDHPTHQTVPPETAERKTRRSSVRATMRSSRCFRATSERQAG